MPTEFQLFAVLLAVLCIAAGLDLFHMFRSSRIRALRDAAQDGGR